MTLYGPVVNTILLKNYSCRIDWDKKIRKVKYILRKCKCQTSDLHNFNKRLVSSEIIVSSGTKQNKTEV